MDLYLIKQIKYIQIEQSRITKRMYKLEKSLSAENCKEAEKLRDVLVQMATEQLILETEIMKQINNISDYQIRLSIQMHYIDGQTWNDVAAVIGGGNTEDSCKKYFYRYFSKHN